MAVTLVRPVGTLVGLPLLPHATTVLLLRRARQKFVPAAIAAMFVRLAGIVPKFVPQFVTEPLLSSARLWSPPAATAVTLVRPVGTLVWLAVFRPHATMSFLILKAKRRHRTIERCHTVNVQICQKTRGPT